MAQGDRYDPLPSLPELPGYLVRKIPPRARRPLGVAAALLGMGVVVAIVLAAPAIDRGKAERAAAEREARAAQRAELVARLRAEQRPRRGAGDPARGVTARRALAADLAAAVAADARTRVRAGEFAQSVDRVECERYPRGARGEDPATDLEHRRGRYSCLAVTADAPALETSNPSSIGYPYRALVDFPRGTYAFCKVSGRPGEGSLEREILARVPDACGG